MHTYTHLRLNYELVVHADDNSPEAAAVLRVTEPARIRARLSDVVDQGAIDLRTGLARPEHVLLRMANQSLVADCLAELNEYLLRPELHTSVVVKSMDLLINLVQMTLEANVLFQVSTVSSGNLRRKKRHGGDDEDDGHDRLTLGSLSARVEVNLGQGVRGAGGSLSMAFSRPELRVVLDESLRDAAQIVAASR